MDSVVLAEHLPDDGPHRGSSRDVLDVPLRVRLADPLVGGGPDRDRAAARLELGQSERELRGTGELS